MISLPTAKVLLFIALAVGPKGAPMVYATSNSDSYVWSPTKTGWVVESKRFPLPDFTRSHIMQVDINGNPSHEDMPENLRAVAKHDWSHDSVMIFENGDRIEKDGNHAYYIINAGGPNQQVFTIFFSASDDPGRTCPW